MNDTIEISNQSAPPALREALEAGYVRRDKTRASAEQAATTLTRAQRLSSVAANKVAELSKSLEAAQAEQACGLASQIAAGAPTDTLLPSNLDAVAIASELASAKLHASISAKALASIQTAHEKAQAELASAERAVVAAVDALLDEERVGIAIQVQYHLDQAVKLGKSLLFEAIADEMTTRRQPPAQVKAALARLDLPLVDRFNVTTSMWRTGDQAALALRAARRAEMISGQSAPVDEAAAA
jgi:hypothetical protein